ncbi:hypothetical protein PAV_3c02470 [Paenibacillus alvei DSM 29]|nr:hypothetical protein PAV_3c02470 [Paenibacillus alvei DSM 29]
MDINLVPVTFEEKESFVNLYQFYLYDFSLYTDQDVN